jgi:DNA-binding XRE family transcriptional regulator
MRNPVENGCRPNERYGRSETARMLGVTRPTITSYEERGLKFTLAKNLKSMPHRYRGIDIIKFYNTQVF